MRVLAETARPVHPALSVDLFADRMPVPVLVVVDARPTCATVACEFVAHADEDGAVVLGCFDRARGEFVNALDPLGGRFLA
jgi:hypothetical protein